MSQGQLIAAGIPRDAIRRRVSAGYLLRLHRGVYAVGHRSDIALGPETAALLACRDGALLSHHSAAALRGLLDFAFGAALDHRLRIEAERTGLTIGQLRKRVAFELFPHRLVAVAPRAQVVPSLKPS